MNDNILNIENLSKTFSRSIVSVRGAVENERLYIIKDLNLFIPKGKITALIGGNGAGKTTLFNIISRFTNAEKGEITYNDSREYDLLAYPSHKIKQLGIGRLFQDNHIFSQMTVLENMMIADSDEWGELPFISLFKKGKNREIESKRKNRAKRIFAELFGEDNPFWEKRNDLASSLSHGQQRLLALARLFMGDYKLVLLDEPTAGVNPEIVKIICGVIKKMSREKGITVFLIEHNMKIVAEIADFCSFISHGEIAAFGTPDDVIGDVNVRRTYLGL